MQQHALYVVITLEVEIGMTLYGVSAAQLQLMAAPGILEELEMRVITKTI